MKTRAPHFRLIVLAAASMMFLADGPAMANSKYKHGSKHRSRDNVRAEETRHEARDNVIMINEGDRSTISGYYSTHAVSCPPYGMRKRTSACNPAGTPVKYNRGDVLSMHSGWEPLPRDLIGGLRPAPSGSRYVRVGNDVYLVSSSTGEIYDHVYVGNY